MRDHSELILRNQSDFSRVYNHGKSRGGRFAVVLYRKNGLKYSRTAFVASKKVGNSVVRSRVTRLLRESYRLTEEKVSRGYDIVIIARASISGLPFAEVDRSLKHLLRKQNLLK